MHWKQQEQILTIKTQTCLPCLKWRKQVQSLLLDFTLNLTVTTQFVEYEVVKRFAWLSPNSVTRLGDFLHFGQLFKAFGNN